MAGKGRDVLTGLVRERLAGLRDQFGMSEAGVARAAGQRQQDVNRFFLGDTKYPPLDFLDALARVFHYSLAEIMAEDLPPSALTDKQRGILANLKAMEPNQRAAFEALVHPRKAKGGSGRRRG